jgi:hypothetical protein
MLDVDMITEHKDKMRDIILHGDIESNKSDILQYCMDDTEYLKPLFEKTFSVIKAYSPSYNSKCVLEYGKWMLNIACIECNGIPLDIEKIKTFSENYSKLSVDIPTQCNKVRPFFVWDEKKSKFTRNYNLFKDFVTDSGIPWPKTEKGKFKQDKKTLESLQNSFLEVRTYHNTISSLKEIGYFAPTRLEKMLDSIGSDNHWRGSLMPYGSATSRNQPRPSTGYVFGMSRWLRNLVSGVIIGGDYSAQEIYIQGYLSNDLNMLDSYKTGDPYTWFAKKSGIIPSDIDRKKGVFYQNDVPVNEELQLKCSQSRALCKSMLLGLGYGMGEDSLGLRLTAANIEALPEDERVLLLRGDKTLQEKTKIVGREDKALYPKKQRADYYLDMYERIYSTYKNWKTQVYNNYRYSGSIVLSDGWTRIGYDGNKTSVVNFPVQGEAAVILRKAVDLCLNNGLKVSTTLHDAIYIETTQEDKLKDSELLHKCMSEAVNGKIRVDVHEQIVDWNNFKSNWSDEKGFEEFSRFGKYFLRK